jgi:hypothetical protein
MAKNDMGILLLGLGLLYFFTKGKQPGQVLPSTIGGTQVLYYPVAQPYNETFPESEDSIVEEAIVNGNGGGRRRYGRSTQYPKVIGSGVPVREPLEMDIIGTVASLKTQVGL